MIAEAWTAIAASRDREQNNRRPDRQDDGHRPTETETIALPVRAMNMDRKMNTERKRNTERESNMVVARQWRSLSPLQNLLPPLPCRTPWFRQMPWFNSL